jgi:hypothetical protein
VDVLLTSEWGLGCDTLLPESPALSELSAPVPPPPPSGQPPAVPLACAGRVQRAK